MSLLPPEVHASLSQLLSNLASSENEIRTRAEEQLNQEWVANQPEILLMGLVEQIHNSQDVGVSCVKSVAFSIIVVSILSAPSRLARLLLFSFGACQQRLEK